ncbi:hypothetical protein HanIR_Chr08g0359991 [Helianthus annuus]|nr:hypothetical protein HanIR_Chr08g0359991 [Helianthus annuus]
MLFPCLGFGTEYRGSCITISRCQRTKVLFSVELDFLFKRRLRRNLLRGYLLSLCNFSTILQ